MKGELSELQARYLDQLGSLYAELGTLDEAVTEAEVRAGLRPPPLFDERDPELGDDSTSDAPAGCSHRSAPSAGLKRMFRDLAKAVHPDRAPDERARYRRHSLMAEANRAYAERDEDRLRLILHTWERSPESVVGDNPEAQAERVRRRLASLDEQLFAIEAEWADLRGSAIARLKTRIDEARSQGWDLFGEMILQVKGEIGRARARLASLSRAKVQALPSQR
jgi:hypothetical protein